MFNQLEKKSPLSSRRNFLKTGLVTGAGALFASRFIRGAESGAAPPPVAPASSAASALPSKVALTHGDNRTDNIFRALKSLETETARAIGNRRVVIKPNLVSTNNQLAATHVDALTGILEFLKSIGKLDNAIIAESSAGRTIEGFQNFGYTKLEEKYKVKLVDLDQEGFETVMAFSQADVKPHPVRVSSILTNQEDNFIISACMLKTHNFAVATMSIKNIILGAPLKLPNPNAGGGRGGRGFGGSDKPILHGGGSHGININLAMLAPLLHPSLSVIDGFEGMEGNGPIGGTPVDHRVCVVSTDYLAADTVGATLMGIDPGNIGYLSYLATAKVGESDLGKMEILGEPVASLARKYQLGPSIQNQLQWKNPAKVTAAG
ncbi:MAG TPA: DUF362 domain-containing protein [Verrucomicrobiae bacterium]|nr:DUF362 domain-containing protein [Verrucomicrobiae bacterium]